MLAARSLILGAGIALTITVPNAGLVLAQSTGSKALAEQLFEQGRELAKTNKWAEACSKFEASLRYDVALGTRLNLATCYEKTGKLASAWAMFRDSAALASRADDAARRDYALQQAMALVPRLPELTIAGPTSPPAGFAVTRDGLALDLATLGIALYVDPGSHVVTASAPGFEPFRTAIAVGEAESGSVVIPEPTPVRTAVYGDGHGRGYRRVGAASSPRRSRAARPDRCIPVMYMRMPWHSPATPGQSD